MVYSVAVFTMLMFLRQVESSNEARAYGTGEVIVIEVIFNHAVVLYGEPTLVLETGVFNQEVSQAMEAVHPPLERSCHDFAQAPVRSTCLW